MAGHIYVYGEIMSWQDDDASAWGMVNLKDIKNQLDANRDEEELIVHINSNGGDVFEGFAIHDMIKGSGKKVTTVVEGLAASIATIIMLAGDTRQITPNSSILVHNPWGMAMGDSDDIQKYADELVKIEDKIADMYAAATSMDIDDLKALMAEDRYMDSDEALAKGFITEVVEQIKAVAKLNINHNTMTNLKTEDVQKMINDSLDPESNPSLWEKIKAAFTKEQPKNITLQTGAGDELEFPDVEEGTDPQVGDKANVDGSAAEGDYTMPDGTVYTFEAGELTVITPPSSGEEDDDMEALKAELAEKDKKIEELENAQNSLKEEFDKFKSTIESDPGIKRVRETNNEGEATFRRAGKVKQV